MAAAEPRPVPLHTPWVTCQARCWSPRHKASPGPAGSTRSLHSSQTLLVHKPAAPPGRHLHGTPAPGSSAGPGHPAHTLIAAGGKTRDMGLILMCPFSLGTRLTSSFCCLWEHSAGQRCPRVRQSHPPGRGHGRTTERHDRPLQPPFQGHTRLSVASRLSPGQEATSRD